MLDLVGQNFGRLTVIRFHHSDEKNRYWECKCSCGNTILCTTGRLRSGNTRSCGCLRKETSIKNGIKNVKYDGEAKGKYKRLLRIYYAMLHRCYNKNDSCYHHYGGRGISVCDEWKNDYFTFKKWALDNGYNDNLTIDRLDHNGNYEPNNCKWATWTEQQNNKSNNKYLTYKGETKTLAQWCRELNLNYARTKARLNTCNMSVEDAFELPKYKKTVEV